MCWRRQSQRDGTTSPWSHEDCEFRVSDIELFIYTVGADLTCYCVPGFSLRRRKYINCFILFYFISQEPTI